METRLTHSGLLNGCAHPLHTHMQQQISAARITPQWMSLTHLGFLHGCAYPAHTRMQHQIPATRIPPIKAYSAWHWANHDGRYNHQHTRHMLPAHYKRRLTSPATWTRGLVQHCPAGSRPRASLGDSACIHYTQERVTRLHLPWIKSNTCSYIKPVGTTT